MTDPPNALQLDNVARIAQIDKRVNEMQGRYYQWAQAAKTAYHRWNALSVICAAAVPVVVLIAPIAHSSAQAPWVAAAADILGAFATLFKSIDSLYKNHDTWLRNDASYGRITSERFLFAERAGQYKKLSDDERIATYAEQVDAIIGSESEQFSGAEKAPQGTPS